jgi:uncharacterized membrane protein (TIGR02234 family)
VSRPAADRGAARRELGSAVLLVLAGAVLLLVATAGAWVTGVQTQPPPLPSPAVQVGADEAAGPVRALGLVVLAAVPALAATRRTGRTVVGLLLVLAGAGAGAAAVRVLAGPDALVASGVDEVAVTSRPLLALAGSLVTIAAGAVVTARGRRWAALSRRYEAPAARGAGADGARAEPAGASTVPPEPTEAPELWDALDRGEDPTRG